IVFTLCLILTEQVCAEQRCAMPIAVNKYGLYTVTAMIGKKPVRLLIDTGSAVTTLPQPQSVTLDFGCLHIAVHAVKTQTPIFCQLNLGRKERIDGLLGQDVLSVFRRVTIDYKTKQLVFDDSQESTVDKGRDRCPDAGRFEQ